MKWMSARASPRARTFRHGDSVSEAIAEAEPDERILIHITDLPPLPR